MISEREYKEALNTVLEYRKQIFKETEEIFNAKKKVEECNISTRAYHAIQRSCMRYYGSYHYDISVEEVAKIPKHIFEARRNCGKKSMVEIEQMLIEAGFGFNEMK